MLAVLLLRGKVIQSQMSTTIFDANLSTCISMRDTLCLPSIIPHVWFERLHWNRKQKHLLKRNMKCNLLMVVGGPACKVDGAPKSIAEPSRCKQKTGKTCCITLVGTEPGF